MSIDHSNIVRSNIKPIRVSDSVQGLTAARGVSGGRVSLTRTPSHRVSVSDPVSTSQFAQWSIDEQFGSRVRSLVEVVHAMVGSSLSVLFEQSMGNPWPDYPRRNPTSSLVRRMSPRFIRVRCAVVSRDGTSVKQSSSSVGRRRFPGRSGGGVSRLYC